MHSAFLPFLLQHSCKRLAAHCLFDPGVKLQGLVVCLIPEGGMRLCMQASF